MNGLMVFTPENPNIYFLNYTAWAIFELCDGLTTQQLEEAFVDFVADVAPRDEAIAMLADGLKDLFDKGIVELIPPPAESIALAR